MAHMYQYMSVSQIGQNGKEDQREKLLEQRRLNRFRHRYSPACTRPQFHYEISIENMVTQLRKQINISNLVLDRLKIEGALRQASKALEAPFNKLFNISIQEESLEKLLLSVQYSEQLIGLGDVVLDACKSLEAHLGEQLRKEVFNKLWLIDFFRWSGVTVGETISFCSDLAEQVVFACALPKHINLAFRFAIQIPTQLFLCCALDPKLKYLVSQHGRLFLGARSDDSEVGEVVLDSGPECFDNSSTEWVCVVFSHFPDQSLFEHGQIIRVFVIDNEHNMFLLPVRLQKLLFDKVNDSEQELTSPHTLVGSFPATIEVVAEVEGEKAMALSKKSSYIRAMSAEYKELRLVFDEQQRYKFADVEHRELTRSELLVTNFELNKIFTLFNRRFQKFLKVGSREKLALAIEYEMVEHEPKAANHDTIRFFLDEFLDMLALLESMPYHDSLPYVAMLFPNANLLDCKLFGERIRRTFASTFRTIRFQVHGKGEPFLRETTLVVPIHGKCELKKIIEMLLPQLGEPSLPSTCSNKLYEARFRLLMLVVRRSVTIAQAFASSYKWPSKVEVVVTGKEAEHTFEYQEGKLVCNYNKNFEFETIPTFAWILCKLQKMKEDSTPIQLKSPSATRKFLDAETLEAVGSPGPGRDYFVVEHDENGVRWDRLAREEGAIPYEQVKKESLVPEKEYRIRFSRKGFSFSDGVTGRASHDDYFIRLGNATPRTLDLVVFSGKSATFKVLTEDQDLKKECFDLKLYYKDRYCLENTEFMGFYPDVSRPELVGNSKAEEKKKQVDVLFQEDRSRIASPQELKVNEPASAIKHSVIIDPSIEKKYASRAGACRGDVVRLRNEEGHAISDLALYSQLNFYFTHSEKREIVIRPEVRLEDSKAVLVWRPVVRGLYKLVIDRVTIETGYPILVLSARLKFNHDLFSPPKSKKSNFLTNISLYCYFCDEFSNPYTCLEAEVDGLQAYDKVRVVLSSVSSDLEIRVEDSREKIDKYGKQSLTFKLVTQNNICAQAAVTLDVLHEDLLIHVISMEFQGLSIDVRMKQLANELGQLSTGSDSIEVLRSRLLDDLVAKDAKVAGKGSLHVTFLGEPGIDAGGVRREFYDLLGKEVKNSKYALFTGYSDGGIERFFLHPKIHGIKKRLEYLESLGKFIANSIVTRNYIGVCFVDALIKQFYGEPVSFEDMEQVLDPPEYANYLHLRGLSDEQLEDICLTFVACENGVFKELVPGGASLPVRQANLELYLKSLSHFRLVEQFEHEIKAFKKGFQKIIQFKFIQNFIHSNEFNFLICGRLEITPANVLAVLAFRNGNAPLINMFKMYIEECERSILEGFLKFSTGSSVIPFDTAGYAISINFTNSSTKQLPIAHTCFREIEVPKYPKFNVLKVKLDAAFKYGSEGFAFG